MGVRGSGSVTAHVASKRPDSSSKGANRPSVGFFAFVLFARLLSYGPRRPIQVFESYSRA